MNLKQTRQLHQKTQTELAKAIGLSQTQISHIEQGKCVPHKSTRHKIEAFFDCGIDWLEERLKQPIRSIGFVENESAEDVVLKAIKVFILSAQRQERKEKVQFLERVVKHFKREK